MRSSSLGLFLNLTSAFVMRRGEEPDADPEQSKTPTMSMAVRTELLVRKEGDKIYEQVDQTMDSR